jgi:cathepsin D
LSQYFSPVTTFSNPIGNPADGKMGLAFASISQLKAPTIIDNLYSQGKIPAPVFSFHLATSGSELYIGGVNTAKFTGNIAWSNVTDQRYWQITGSSSIGDKVGYSGPMIIDSGSSFIFGPTSSVAKWWGNVAGHEICPKSVCGDDGYYTFPCASPPSVSFTFHRRKFPISHSDFNRKSFYVSICVAPQAYC